MQKSYLPGEKKKAVCPTCEGLVDATFRYGTDVPNVLMLYCDQCDTQMAHAHQSSYLIQKARRSDQSQRTSVPDASSPDRHGKLANSQPGRSPQNVLGSGPADE